MSETISNIVLHPTNPALLKDVNIPKENGQTRVLPDESLLYREPLTNTDVPAVRLNDIRPRLVQEALKKISYRFPKARGFENTNVTAFVKKDYNYGPERDNRPDRLFQIEKDNSKGEKPDGYVMDQGRIVLDAFDHGLRNFGNQLPMYVSSELEGNDIEDYLRRNWEISVYDLVARAPNGYYKGKLETTKKKTKKNEKAREWHDGPPRVGTFSMRATRFRLSAGCLSWDSKDGTAAKNQRIRDLIPAQYKDPAVNSTKGWRDFNKAEIKKIKEGAMKKPQQGPKAKRAAQTEKDLAEKRNTVDHPIEQEGSIEDGEEVEYEDWIGASDKQDNSAWRDHDQRDLEISKPAPFRSFTNPQIGRLMPQGGNALHSQAVMKQNLAGVGMELKRLDSRKRSRSPLNADSDEGKTRAPKRMRITAEAQSLGSEGGLSHVTKPKMVRQQPRVPTASPYAVQVTAPLTAYPEIGGSIDGQEPLPSVSGGGLDFSFQAPHENCGELYNSNRTANAGPLILNTYNSNTQCGSVGLQSQPAQNGSYQVPQPRTQRGKHSDSHAALGAFQVDKANSRFFGPPYLKYNVNSGLEAQDEEVEDYAPASGLHIEESPEYESPVYEPRQILSLCHGSTQHESPLADLQQIPPGSKTIGKRKRTDGSATEHLEGRRPTKRTKGHVSKPAPAPAPASLGPPEPASRAEKSTPVVRFERPTPGYGQMNMQNIEFPQVGRYLPDSLPELLPSVHRKPWSREGLPFETQGLTPVFSSQHWMLDGLTPDRPDTEPFLQAHDPIHENQEVPDSPIYDDAQESAEFHRGQWEVNQAAPSMELDPGWIAWKSYSNA